MSLADAAGGACAFLNLPDGAVGTSTIESKTNFLGAVTEGTTVTATATGFENDTARVSARAVLPSGTERSATLTVRKSSSTISTVERAPGSAAPPESRS